MKIYSAALSAWVYITGFVPAAPVLPATLFLVSSVYSGSTEILTFSVGFSSDPAASVQVCQWQKSADGGSTWTGYDGTSSTYYPSDNILSVGLASGNLRVRVRTENALGVTSGWLSMSSDISYIAPATALALTTNPPAAEAVGSTAVVGASSTASPSDHVHAMPGVFAASGASHTAGFVPDPGSTSGTTRYLREDSTWAATPAGLALSSTTPSTDTVAGSGAVGTGTTAARADHVHPGAPIFVASGPSGAAGFVPTPGTTAGTTRFLREDSTWVVPVILSLSSTTPATDTVAGSGAVGTGTTAARADHVHPGAPVFVASGASHAPGFVPDPGSTAGTTRYLREDSTWVAPAAGVALSSTTPATDTVVGSGAVGTGTTAARSDHVHPGAPIFVASGASGAAGFVPSPGTTAGTAKFLREDATFVVALQKRRIILSFYPLSTTADTGPNLTQIIRLPLGTGAVATNWKPSGPAILHTENGTTTATTFQLYYSANAAAFGSGTAMLSAALSVSGTGRQEANTSSFGFTSLASDVEIAPKWAAQATLATYATLQLEEV